MIFKHNYELILIKNFLGHELEVQQIGKTADESSYMIGRFNNPDRDISFKLFEKEIFRTNDSNDKEQNSLENNIK